MLSKFLVLITLLFSCGRFSYIEPTSSKSTDLSALEEKVSIYKSLLPKHQDIHGFILTDKCDSLLFSGLLSAAMPGTVNIKAAQNSEGQWFRRPGQDCGKEWGNSHSTISRDMILGLMWHVWKNKDLETANQLMQDLKSNFYFLKGQGTPGELLMTPAMLNTLAEMIKALGGPSYSAELLYPVSYSQDTGFVAHLVTWHILLRGSILNYITEYEFNLLKSNAEREPKNPFFQAAYRKYLDGDQSVAVQLLLDEAEWPSNSLPTTNEHCEEWPIQRDYKEHDWGPCPGNREHPGVELIVIYYLILK